MVVQQWSQSRFVKTALPMFGFVVVSWWGLSQLMDSKLKIRSSVRGYDKVEEHDPMARLKRLATAPAVKPVEDELREELAAVQQQLGDVRDYEMKALPPRADE